MLMFCWCWVKILKMKFDQDLCLNLQYDFGKMNSTLGSVVPLAMFTNNVAVYEFFSGKSWTSWEPYCCKTFDNFHVCLVCLLSIESTTLQICLDRITKRERSGFCLRSLLSLESDQISKWGHFLTIASRLCWILSHCRPSSNRWSLI